MGDSAQSPMLGPGSEVEEPGEQVTVPAGARVPT